MSIWRGLIWFLVLVLAVPAAAGAQGFKWWQSDKFKADLALSADQIARLEEVYQGLLPEAHDGQGRPRSARKRPVEDSSPRAWRPRATS